MPAKRSSRKMVVRRKGRRGQKGSGIFGSIGKFFKSAVGFIKKHKLISKIGSAVAPMLGSYAPAATGVSGVAGALGFGRRRQRLKGLGLTPAGSGRCRNGRRCR